jgi:hypothetical protein
MATAPFESPAEFSPRGRIDELAAAGWKRLGIAPASPCSDEVFLRRVFLDAAGTLPTPEEAAAFLAGQSAGKRAALIDSLLDRDEFTDFRTMKWCDLLRVKSEFPINLWPNAVQAYHHWIRAAVRENLPYDRFARELLTASGSNFRVAPVNFYRAVESREPQSIAQAVALTFMGARAEKWPKARLDGMAAFFSQTGYKPTGEWKEEIVFFDRGKKPSGPFVFPDGKPARVAPGQDPREVFAGWLLDPRNPWFARAVSNRVWFWLMGRGIVHQPDDIRPDNPPSNPELLAFLERELAGARYDLKHLFRLILNSQVYQLSPIPKRDSAEAAAAFAFYPVRRLEAETLIDAICQVTGTTEQYSSPIPEPFTFMPEDVRSSALPDGSIGSAFLEMFGRPPRDTGLESERNNRATADQRLHLLNSSHIQLKIQQSSKLRALIQGRPGGRPRDPLDRLYLAILSRYPTGDELKTVTAYLQSGAANNRWPAVVDIAWALINSAEFLYRH